MTVRTDLALECRELVGESEIEGVIEKKEEKQNVKITRIEIKTEKAALRLNKEMGNYITLELSPFSKSVCQNEKEIEIIAREIKSLIPNSNGTVLLVGLGNDNITPDAIGPKTIEASFATRHISESMPELNFRSVALFSPRVLGQTGIESSESVKAMVEKTNAECVIVIDALASKSINRLGCTVQICDTGISPGSGVNNKRKSLNQKSLGVPVIAIGIPTVVDALTIAYEAGGETVQNKNELSEMFVTPREIDVIIENASKVLALSIAKAMHQSYSVEDLYFLSL